MSMSARRTSMLLMLAVAFCLVASVGWADVVVWQNDASYLNGGEFTVQVLDGLTPVTSAVTTAQTYDTDRGRGPGFRTFCVQETQYFGPGNQYRYEIATATDHILPEVPLNSQTAYLFHQFNAGILSNYNYNPAGGARSISAGNLQEAIWSFMVPGHVIPADGFYDQARAWVTEANEKAPAGIGGVKILRLYGPYGSGQYNDAQDQLIETPEPGGLALLAIGALPVLPIVRRRRMA